VAKVRLKATLTIGARNYLSGEVVELTDEQAKVLIEQELAELVEEEKPKKKGGK
jgi:hypothetical protein